MGEVVVIKKLRTGPRVSYVKRKTFMPKPWRDFEGLKNWGDTVWLNFRRVIQGWIERDHTENRKTSEEASGVIQMKTIKKLN